jgi:hypothetical protein
MKTIIYLVIPCLLAGFGVFAQAPGVQTVKGRVIDKDAQQAIIGANVVLAGSDPIIGTITDLNGYFVLNNVPVGRATLTISYLGYHPVSRNQVLVRSGKATFVNVELEESTITMEELIITADQDKTAINNDMALVSARGFNIEETTRYAGSLNDPARMATSFAGCGKHQRRQK